MVFANPLYLLLLLLIIPIIAWYVLKQKHMQAALQVSTTQPFDKMPRTYKIYLRHFNFVLRVLAVVLLIIALDRPQSTDSWQNSSTEGVDIVLALDISGSMLARDFKPDRVEAAKDVAAQFVSGREHDNIGLVIFAGESFTMCPMILLPLLQNRHHDQNQQSRHRPQHQYDVPVTRQHIHGRDNPHSRREKEKRHIITKKTSHRTHSLRSDPTHG